MIELALNEEESQTVFRALLDYRNMLRHSRWSGSPAVEREIVCLDALSERLSLAYQYPPEPELNVEEIVDAAQ